MLFESSSSNAEFITSNAKAIIEKSRDYIHRKVATEEQLLHEKPLRKQLKEKIPTNPIEVEEKIGTSIYKVMVDIKQTLNEEQETPRTAPMPPKESNSNGPIQATKRRITNAIYEATKSSEVRKREEFLKKPLEDKLQEVFNTNQIVEILTWC